MGERESDILRAVLDYLAARHIFSIRVNSGAVVSQYKGKNRLIRMAAPGTADVLAFPQCPYPPHMITPTWLEIKTAKGKQSDLQRSFQAQVEAEGHRYAVCRSIQDVEELLK